MSKLGLKLHRAWWYDGYAPARTTPHTHGCTLATHCYYCGEHFYAHHVPVILVSNDSAWAHQACLRKAAGRG